MLTIKGSAYKLYFDGMIHYLEIRKTKKSDEGTIRCLARNGQGEVESIAKITVDQRTDYRSVLNSSNSGK
jgi:hypothetical protein